MDQATESSRVFQAPTAYVILFYLLLLAWTVGTLPVIYMKFQQVGFQSHWVYASMIGFFYLYTWFWALGLFYRIAMDGEGRIVLRSLRRNLEVTAKQIRTIEGSRFPAGFGFIKMKLPRESGYLFCHGSNRELAEILLGIRKMNPLVKTVRI
ncbi:MAG: hypothetical protein Q8M86_12990 [Syntrophales bacterium]|nr:hypothetical protein [Syntrophales bacterium]MDP3098852.1 hypothetical protein [Syntrophales bacterium]